MEGRPQLDRTYLPHPATTAEMYLAVMLDELVQIRQAVAGERPVPQDAVEPVTVELREPLPLGKPKRGKHR